MSKLKEEIKDMQEGPVVIVIEEHNKKMLQAIDVELSQAEVQFKMAKFQYDSILSKKKSVVNTLINQLGCHGTEFELRPDYTLVEKTSSEPKGKGIAPKQ